MKKLTIAMPVYNEERNIDKIVKKIKKVKFPLKVELILVDDNSNDSTREKIWKIKGDGKIIVKKFYHKKNMGKGSAVRTAIENSSGDLFVIQDADLEYNPEEIVKLIEFMNDEKAEVVYGSRMLGNNKYSYISYLLGNIFLNFVTNLLYGTKLTDMETCYKLIPKEVIKKVNLKSRGFDMEPEITAKISLMGYSIKEMGISYMPRSKEEGKKIRLRDGLFAVWALIYWRIKGIQT